MPFLRGDVAASHYRCRHNFHVHTDFDFSQRKFIHELNSERGRHNKKRPRRVNTKTRSRNGVRICE